MKDGVLPPDEHESKNVKDVPSIPPAQWEEKLLPNITSKH